MTEDNKDRGGIEPDENNQPGFETNFSSPGQSGLHPKLSPVKAGILGLAGGFFFFQILGSLLGLAIFGNNIEIENLNAFRLLQIATQILFLLLPALIFSKLIYEDVSTVIRFRLPKLAEIGLFSLGIFILTIFLNSFVIIQNYFVDIWVQSSPFLQSLKSTFDQLSEMVEKAYSQLMRIENGFDVVIVIAVVAVTPAICEEVMFRGYIQRSFELRFKKFGGALITALFFGLYHFNPFALIPLITLGLYFGYAAYKTDSIFTAIILHFINNFMATILIIIFGESELDQNFSVNADYLKPAIMNMIYTGIMFLALIAMINLYYKIQDNNKRSQNISE